MFEIRHGQPVGKGSKPHKVHRALSDSHVGRSKKPQLPPDSLPPVSEVDWEEEEEAEAVETGVGSHESSHSAVTASKDGSQGYGSRCANSQCKPAKSAVLMSAEWG